MGEAYALRHAIGKFYVVPWVSGLAQMQAVVQETGRHCVSGGVITEPDFPLQKTPLLRGRENIKAQCVRTCVLSIVCTHVCVCVCVHTRTVYHSII